MNADVFIKHDKEYLKFDRVENKITTRPDLHAFILLDKLVPSKKDIISGAEHDEIFLDVNVEELLAVATEEQIIELVRCGVFYDSDSDALKMFT